MTTSDSVGLSMPLSSSSSGSLEPPISVLTYTSSGRKWINVFCRDLLSIAASLQKWHIETLIAIFRKKKTRKRNNTVHSLHLHPFIINSSVRPSVRPYMSVVQKSSSIIGTHSRSCSFPAFVCVIYATWLVVVDWAVGSNRVFRGHFFCSGEWVGFSENHVSCGH